VNETAKKRYSFADEGLRSPRAGRHSPYWNMLQTGETFNDPGGYFYSERNPDRAKRRVLVVRR